MSTYYDNADEAKPGLVRRGHTDRQGLLRKETEDYLRGVSEAIAERRAELWHPDHSSPDAFLRSVAPNRERWRAAVGDFCGPVDPGEPLIEPWLEDDVLEAWWVTIPWRANLRVRAVLALPENRTGRLPVVLAQHGIGSSPERCFGFDDDSDIYHSYARRLVNDGFAVIAPLHLTEGPPRARLQRLCLMLGGTLWGLEIAQYHHLLDVLLQRPELDPERLGMWGISLGGAYTLMTMPLEPRIKAGIVCAWFNHRVRKMVADDPRHSCFLSVNEEHIYVHGWLREFSDSDLCALICPRPVMMQTGKADGIGWWPWIGEEFAASQAHYEKLGVGERIVWDLHEAGHEIQYESGVGFLRKWV
ncbi:MAG: hypothetical protein HYU66_16210 [Armatimonadetes bacterium]|nr:hypothetical protein [Armatimonadota bacterium]